MFRFAKSHTNDDLTQKIKLPSKGYLKTLNAETIILQKALRKKEYDFSKCEQVSIFNYLKLALAYLIGW